MKNLIKYTCTLGLILLSPAISAQNAEMADAMRSNGKIYVVVSIILIVLAGMLAYLFFIDKKLNKMEKELNTKKQTKS